MYVSRKVGLKQDIRVCSRSQRRGKRVVVQVVATWTTIVKEVGVPPKWMLRECMLVATMATAKEHHVNQVFKSF